MRYLHTLIMASAIALCACSGNEKSNGNSGTDKAQLTRLDKVVAGFSTMSPEQQFATVDSLTVPLNDYIYLMGASTGDIVASIDSLSHTAAFAMFEPEVNKSFPSTDRIEEKLGTLNENTAGIFPLLPHYSYYGIVSPYRQQVMLVDSMVFISLNHYLGENHEAYSSMPAYARATKKQEYIPLDIAEAILSVEYPFKPDDTPTAIQYFIYEGALLKSVSELTDISDIATLMGWTPEQLALVQQHEADIWRKMATDNIIYSTDMTLADRLCAQAPSSQPISPDLPGRIGRYIGYRIVTSYLSNNPGTNLPQILSPSFYNTPTTLIDSRYSPQ